MVIARIAGVCHKFLMCDTESDTSCVTESSAVLVTLLRSMNILNKAEVLLSMSELCFFIMLYQNTMLLCPQQSIRCCIAMKYLIQCLLRPSNICKYYLGTHTIVLFF
jgi:hypothetical protein